MKRLNRLMEKLGLISKPTFSDQLKESIESSSNVQEKAATMAEKSIATPVLDKLVSMLLCRKP